MKKLFIIFTLLCLTSLMAIMGFQEMQTNSIHMMDGKMVTNHEMPQSGCDAKNCLVSVTPVILFASIGMKVLVKEFTKLFFLALAFMFSWVVISKNYGQFFASVPIKNLIKDRGSVVFRE